MGYFAIDGDTHMNEPHDVWLTRTPSHLHDRVPRVERRNGREVWLYEGGKRMRSVTLLCNVIGVSPVQWGLFCESYADLPQGAFHPEARLKDMDVDMTTAHVLYPTYVMAGAQEYTTKDRELQLACVRAYNDWMSEFCSVNPGRFFGLATLPVTSVEDAMAEAERVRGLTGIRGLLLTCWPNGGALPDHDADDRFWDLVEDLDIACTIHVGFFGGGEVGEASAEDSDSTPRISLPMLNVSRQGASTIPIFSQLILGGVLERHPKLRIGVAEVGVGWLPFFMEQTDDNYVRHRFWTGNHLKLLPSDYLKRQLFSTFQQDTYGIKNREYMIDNIMWSSDYPHSGADWPNSRVTIANHMRGVPDDEQRKILAGNAMRLYGVKESDLTTMGALPAKTAVAV